MKRCPACNNIYRDNDPAFCPNDGATLMREEVTAGYYQPAAPSTAQRSRPKPMRGYILASRIALWVSFPAILAGIVVGVIAHVKMGGFSKSGNNTALIAVFIFCFGVVTLITALLSISAFSKYARSIDEMFSSRNLLAYWTYPPDASNKHRGGEAYISSNGVMLNGKYHVWGMAFSALASVAFEPRSRSSR